MNDEPKVTLDVNTLVSGFLKGGGPPSTIIDLWRAGRLQVCLSTHIIETVQRIWERPYFVTHSDRIDRALAIDLMDEQTEPFTPDPTVTGVADDEEDDRVLGTAVAAGADYLVTGDAGLLRIGEYRGVRIVTAREFLILIDAS
jgi:putative PIN family toxin of toxin-antitoxin system